MIVFVFAIANASGIVVDFAPALAESQVEMNTRLLWRPDRLALMSFENTTDWAQSPESSRNPV